MHHKQWWAEGPIDRSSDTDPIFRLYRSIVSTFFGKNRTRFARAILPKNSLKSRSRAHPLKPPPRNVLARIKNFTHGAV